MAHLFHKSFPP